MILGKKSHYTNVSKYVLIFKMDAEMSVIFADFSREKSLKNPSIDINRSEMTDIVILVQNW